MRVHAPRLGAGAAALAVLAVVAVVAYGWFIFTHGELADKPAYAELQSIEYASRNQALPLVVLRKGDLGDDVLGVKSDDARYPHVWILLNRPLSEGGVAAVPDLDHSRIEASCADIADAVRPVAVSSTVMQGLSRRCKR